MASGTDHTGRFDETMKKIRAELHDLPDLLKTAVSHYVLDRQEDEGESVHSAGAIGSQVGRISELTMIAPLVAGGADRLRRIIKVIKGNFRGARKVGTLHDMRFVFIDNDTKLMFATTYDGDWDTYIDDFATKIPDLMDILFSSVEGWPGIKSPTVKDFIQKFQLTADGWYVAFPDLSVAETARLRKLKVALDEFLEKIG